jgi:glycosyltransferase involved in cell wall biosynthesis
VRVLLHCVYFPPEVGGLESHVYYLARGLVEREHEVNVVTSRSLPHVPVYEEMDGIRVWRTWFPGRTPLGWVAHAFGSCGRTRSLARDAEVIHAQAFPSVVPCAWARRGSNTPLVATFHTSHFLTRARRAGWSRILGSLVRLPDYALASSEEIASVAEALSPGTTVEPLTNGVDTRFFRRVDGTMPVTERRRIVVPRRLFQKNGVEFMVRALPFVLEEVEVEVVFIGDGPERKRLEELAAELGVTSRVNFLGKRAHAEMPGLLSSAELAVIPSLMEATSVAALESMACGLPVAASRVGGLPQIVDDHVGALFEPGDPEGLATAVVGLLNREDLGELGRRARDRVQERWSNDRLVDRHLEIYAGLLKRTV